MTFKLTNPLPLDDELLSSPNLATRIPDEELTALGHQIIEDFTRDLDSRTEWERRMEDALKMALQVKEMKTFPWEGAANVKFPLVTIAAIQYQSRAYPALVNGPNPIACEPLMPRPNPVIPMGLQQLAQQDEQAKKKVQEIVQNAFAQMEKYDSILRRCKAISRHMSYQILEQDTSWEEEHDKALFIQALLGCVFKKTYFDPISGENRSVCVSPKDLVISYYTKSLESSPRFTHVVSYSPNECHERVARGVFCEVEDTGAPVSPSFKMAQDEGIDKRQGIMPIPQDHDAPYVCLEHYCYLDLDGDGYAEPYTVTVKYDSKQVLRIVARYTRTDITYTHSGKVIRIDPIHLFTKYPFIPSPDGGFYDLGFGALLGPINETVSSAINQLLDAGTLANAGGGFLGRGFRNKRGEYRFRPGEWKSVDSTGDDLRKNILPLPAPQPSTVLFELITVLIQYGESVAGATDVLQGKNPGQNTPAETGRAMVEQGMKVFNGIYKRTHRAFTQEIRKLFRLNTIYLTGENYFVSNDAQPKEIAKLYSGAEIMVRAAADPFYMSDSQRYNQAVSIFQAAHSSPGWDVYQADIYYLEALKVANPDRFRPDPKSPYAPPPPINPKIQQEQLKQQTAQLKLAQEKEEFQLTYKLKQAELMAKVDDLRAHVMMLEAQAAKLYADAGDADVGHEIALINAQIGAKKNHMDGLLEAIRLLHEISSTKESKDGTSDEGGARRMAGGPSNNMLSGYVQSAVPGAGGPMGGGQIPQ